MFRPDYNIHFFNKDFVLINTSQKKMLNFNLDDILCTPLYRFLPPAEAVSMMAAILTVFETGLPLWHAYSFRDYSFFWLINKIGDDITAAHEVFDDPDNRERLKRFLLVAAGNFKKKFKAD